MDNKRLNLIKTMEDVSHAFIRYTKLSLEEQAATLLQYQVLDHIHHSNRATVGSVAQALFLSKSSATQLIERLVKANLVTRLQGTTDRRIVKLKLTDHGTQQTQELRSKINNYWNQTLKHIPEEDINHLLRIHTSLLTKINLEITTKLS